MVLPLIWQKVGCVSFFLPPPLQKVHIAIHRLFFSPLYKLYGFLFVIDLSSLRLKQIQNLQLLAKAGVRNCFNFTSLIIPS